MLFATSVQAQLAERRGLTLEGAKKVMSAAVAEAKKDIGTGVIAIVDEGGHLMALERLDNTFPAGALISIGKARTAAIFRRPTKVFEDIIAKGRTAMTALPDSLFTPLQGGVPILAGDQVVGAIGVSGAASAQRDEEIALAGAAAMGVAVPAGDTMGAASPDVTYFEENKVSAAFAKGVPLLEISNYKIHASRREAPGLAEVHQKDTDIIHVLDGTAVFVTGGTVVEGKTTAQDEIRGASIQGGDSRTLRKGDVIVVPKGTPHWFKEVKGTFLYYVVKVS
jgi:glc operon protein GlcG